MANSVSAKEIQVQHNAQNGTTVHFHLNYDGTNVNVENIVLHSNFPSGLPSYPQLRFNDAAKEYQLYHTYDKDDNGEIKKVSEFLTNPYSKRIVQEILQMKERETPNFGG